MKDFYKKKFFEDFYYVLKLHGKEYATIFFIYINPYFDLNEKVGFSINQIIKKYDNLLNEIPNDFNILKNMVKTSKF